MLQVSNAYLQNSVASQQSLVNTTDISAALEAYTPNSAIRLPEDGISSFPGTSPCQGHLEAAMSMVMNMFERVLNMVMGLVGRGPGSTGMEQYPIQGEALLPTDISVGTPPIIENAGSQGVDGDEEADAGKEAGAGKEMDAAEADADEAGAGREVDNRGQVGGRCR